MKGFAIYDKYKVKFQGPREPLVRDHKLQKTTFSNNNNFGYNKTFDSSNKFENNYDINNKQFSKNSVIKKIASVEKNGNSQLPLMKFNIKDANITSLIDSGSTISLMCPSLFENLKNQDIKFKYLASRIQIHTLNNSVIPFKHCIKLKFKIHNIFTEGTFFITTNEFDKKYNLLLGYDYLKQNRMILDCNKQTLNFKHLKIPLQFTLSNSQTNSIDNEIQKSCKDSDKLEDIHTNSLLNQGLSKKQQLDNIIENECDSKSNNSDFVKINRNKVGKNENLLMARTMQKYHLQPHQCMTVQLQCPNSLEPGDLIMLEPVRHNLKILYDCSIHKISKDMNIHIMITNNSGYTITINKNMKIGKLSKNFIIKDNIENNGNTDIIYEVNTLSMDEVKKLREKQLKAEDFNLDHLSKDIKMQFLNTLLNKAHAFSKTYNTLGQTSLIEPKFNLLHNYPIQTKPYKIPQHIQQFAKNELTQLLQAGIIENTDSQYAFPVVFVKKKSNSKTDKPEHMKYRLAVDFRLLNQILENNLYPIPDSKQILQAIGGKKFYSSLDFHSAFLQVNVNPQDRHKLAFITEFGHFAFRKLPFGVRISSSVFAKLIDRILGHFDKNKVRYYIDDVIIATDSVEEMSTLLNEILDELIKYNVTIDPAKMQICKKEIEFLGFKIHQHGYSPSDKNIHKIQNFAKPKSKKAVQSLLGLTNYFRFLIRNYSEIVNPLVELTKAKQKFHWTDEADYAFNTLQEAILQSPTVKTPDYGKEFFLITDGSKIAISAILVQEENGLLFPLEFYGRKLRDSETRYPSMKIELLAIHQATVHFKNILLGRKFTIITDSKCLTQHIDLNKQSDLVNRWLMDLQQFDFQIEHIQGKINPADYVSRNINALEKVPTTNNEQNLFKKDMDLSVENIELEQFKDSKLCKIINDIRDGKTNKTSQKFELLDNKLLVLKQSRKNGESPLIIAPEVLKIKIIEKAHAPHFGFFRSYDIVKRNFYWYGMYQQIKKFCANCTQCNINKAHKIVQTPIQKMPKDHKVGHVLHTDIIGKLPLSLNKNSFILTIVDSFSRFLEAVPLRNVSSNTILNEFNRYFAKYGLPREIHLDNAKYFRSKMFTDYMKNLDIQLHFSSVYRPQSNGLAESVNRIIKQSVAAISDNTFQWDITLDFFKLSYNSSKHRSTNFTPNMLFFARELITPFTTDIIDKKFELKKEDYTKNRFKHIQEVHKIALENQNKIMEEYNKFNPNIKTPKFELGQKVFLKAFIKPLALNPKYHGPFEIIKSFRNNNYLLKNIETPNRRLIKVHVSKLYCPKYLK